MFWKKGGLSMVSPIEAILDKSSFTLEELLEEDDLIQECRSLNGRLIDFLMQKENVEMMLKYMLNHAKESASNSISVNSHLSGEDRMHKMAWQCCEVFCCETSPIIDVLLNNEDIMSKLLNTLEREEPLDPISAGYFGRVMNHLLLRKASALAECLSRQTNGLQKFIDRLEDVFITEVVIKLLGADEQTNPQLTESYKEWLKETNVLKTVIEKMQPMESKRVQGNASQVLITIIRTPDSSLSDQLVDDISLLDQVLKYIVDGEGNISMPALNVCIAAMDPKRRIPDTLSPLNSSFNSSLSMSIDRTGSNNLAANNRLFQVLQVKLNTFLPEMVKKLREFDAMEEIQETPYGMLRSPLGQGRLKILEMMGILLSTQNSSSMEAMIKAEGLEICLELFVQYPFNNILHKHVTSMLTTAIKSDFTPLLEHMFEKMDLLQWIIDIPKTVNPDKTKIQFTSPEDPAPSENGRIEVKKSKSKEQQQLRVGYLGHVMYIANQILKCSEFSTYIDELLMCRTNWQEYVTSDLKILNEIADLRSWRCGRPTDLPSVDDDEQQASDILITSNGGNRYIPGVDDEEEEANRDAFDDDDDDDGEQHLAECGIDWNPMSGVVSSVGGDIIGTAAMISKLTLVDMESATTRKDTATTSAYPGKEDEPRSSSSSSSSQESGSHSSSSIDTESSEEEEDEEQETHETQQTGPSPYS